MISLNVYTVTIVDRSKFLILIVVLLIPLQIGLNPWFNFLFVLSGYFMIYLGCRFTKISLSDLGLSKDQFKKSLKPSLLIALGINLALLVAFLVNQEMFKDNRYNQSIVQALSYVFLVLPIKTVLIEELLFRGVLLAGMRKKVSFRKSAIISSVAFGLWHVPSSRHTSTNALPPIFGIFERPLLVLAIVIATFCAGLLLCEVRKRFDSLYVPIVAHWMINGSGILFAYWAWS